MTASTAKERFLVLNTLSCIPTLLERHAVLIDLRNETSVAGIIEKADGFMNIHLVDAVFIDRHGLQYEFDVFLVKSRFIRQIHIPESVDIAKKLNIMLENVGKRAPRSTKTTFKQKRARERHEKVLKEIAEQNKEMGK